MTRSDWVTVIVVGLLLMLLAIQSKAEGLVVNGSDRYWLSMSYNAVNSFDMLGEESVHLVTPARALLEQELVGVQYLYIVAHGYYNQVYALEDEQPVTATEIKDITGEIPFIFIAACDGMCAIGEGTFADVGTESVGYCHMDAPRCRPCWDNAILGWQVTFFSWLREKPVKASFDLAMQRYPQCGECIFYNEKPAVKAPILLPFIPLLLKG